MDDLLLTRIALQDALEVATDETVKTVLVQALEQNYEELVAAITKHKRPRRRHFKIVLK